ncbi:3-coathanger stack domain-containing protein [Emticicia sp. C21]|uniref:3-coathanger stack domain-containing protein n=1 Tax=Emticicia sp. C21 TaxID=2302915 RepID=UPI000E35609C|nr:3-coathanger stack domain-containing protein [Emticicia sp. C21]RFS17519.1 hypothetical protein D0T08_07020 [Emticicia sp. C21]
MYKQLLLLFLLINSFNSYSQKLLKDIASSDASSNISGEETNINYLVKGDTLFFTAQDSAFYSQYLTYKNIWFTDGTSANTKRITNGNQLNQPASFQLLALFKGKVYYKDLPSPNLYVTEGNGINILKTFDNSKILKASVMNGWLYVFVSNTSANRLELWKTDGTAINTTKVTDIHTGTHSFTESSFLNGGNKIYFSFSNDTSGNEPWVTDGTAGGTKILKDIIAGSGSSYVYSFVKAGNTIFFIGPGSNFNPKIWKTDGTEAGTVIVADVIEGNGFYYPRNMKDYDDYLYFSANSNRLYKTDGNTITLVSTNVMISGGIVKMNNLMYFIRQTYAGEFELWKSNGSTEGTEKIKTILASSLYSNGGIMVRILPAASKIYMVFSYFINSPFENITQHWVSDGTTAGTVNMNTLNPNFSTGSVSNQLAVVGDTYYFTGYDSVNGFELWKSNGTSAGTLPVKNINKTIASSNPAQFVALNNNVYFSADDVKYGREIWKTDGTAASTQLLMDYNAGVGWDVNYSSLIAGMINYNDVIISSIGAQLVKFSQTMPPTPYYSHNLLNPENPEFIRFNNLIFYKGYDNNIAKYALFVTDGNTVSKVKEVYTVWNGGPANFLISGGLLYFTTDNSTKIWKSDGTEVGTVLVKSFPSGSIRSKFYEVNGKLMFVYEGPIYGRELWKTDGTEAGTVLVKDIIPGTEGSGIDRLVVFNNQLFFTAYNGTAFGLYRSDGSSANTQLFSSTSSSNVPVVFKNKLHFLTYEFTQPSVYFYYLWSTDGISAPVKVKQVGDNTTRNSQNIQLVNINNRLLVFNIVSNTSRIEIWGSDGTTAGTNLMKIIRDKESNNYDMNIKEYFYHNNKLYFAADDGTHGSELWVLDFDCPESMTLTNSISQDTDFKVDKYIVGSNKINANIKASYNANKYITLNPGFETQSGSRFTAIMSGCINVEATSNSTIEGPVFKNFSAKGNTKPSILQFLNDSANTELRQAYESEKNNHREQNIAWIIDESQDRYILKMRVGEKEWIGYLPK